MRKTILYGIIIFQLLLVWSLIRGIQSSRRSSSRIDTLKIAKEKLVEEKKKLESERQYIESPYYLEKVAREELRLAKPGETVVIIPNERLNTVQRNITENEKPPEKPNWQKWWEVVSGRI